jgi:hypothetical protein
MGLVYIRAIVSSIPIVPPTGGYGPSRSNDPVQSLAFMAGSQSGHLGRAIGTDWQRGRA